MSSMKDTNYNIDDIFAVIVLHKQSLDSSKTILSLNESLKRNDSFLDVLVYDNSPQPQFSESSFQLLNCRINYMNDLSNPGVSKAYNVAAQIAKKSNKSWLLLLDQDTEFPENTIQTYLNAMNTHEDQDLFVPILLSSHGVFSPSKYYFKKGFLWLDVRPGVHSLKHRTVLNSGTLVSTNAFIDVGGYNEKIRLYFSDFNFIDKLRKKVRGFVVIDLVCKHQLSDQVNINLDDAKIRFNQYCEGSFQSAESISGYLSYFATVFLRSVLLSFRYSTPIFIKIFIIKYFRLK